MISIFTHLQRLACATLAFQVALVAGVGASPIRFRDAGEAWNATFRHRHGGTGDFYMIETMGSGVVIFDYDGDGDRDLFFVDSGPLPVAADSMANPGPVDPRAKLLRNDGQTFADVTALSGIVVTGYGMGATAGDVDGDGDVDLYVTAFGPNQLLVNDGDGTFTDATAEAGVGDASWSTSAAFADADGDGDLDLYVTNYLDFAFDDNPLCGDEARQLRSYCHPDVYDGLPDRFYRNRGDGTFDDATDEAGLSGLGGADAGVTVSPGERPAAVTASGGARPTTGRLAGKGLGVVFADLDADGDQDLYVANDMTPNFLFSSRGNGTFEEVALAAGTALSDVGTPEAGMGIAVGDVDANGHLDLLVTHLDLQTNALYSNTGTGIYVDRRYASRLGRPSMFKVGFGTAFADLDLDGDLDLVIANGHIIHIAEQFGNGSTYRQKNQVFENLGGGVFEEVTDAGLDAVRASRGLAVGDLDGDGDLDLAISNSNDLAEIYENVTSPGPAPDGEPAPMGSWLQLDLAMARGNRFAVGARVELEAGGSRQVSEVRTGSSYLSQSDLTLHFGLGGEHPERLTVRWPDGHRLRLLEPPAGRRLRLIRPLR